MTNDNFKKLLDEAIKPLKEGQEELRKELAGFKTELAGFKTELTGFKTELTKIKDTIETRVLPPLVYVETTVKSYADRYVTNEDHIGRLQKRVSTVEDKLGIIPPQDLTIPSVKSV